MSLSICSFSSGSSGNCYLIKSEKTAILIDAGISATRILSELRRSETSPDMVKSLFVTHEHYDHVTGVRVLMNKLKEMTVFASRGTMAGLERRDSGQNHSFRVDVAAERKHIMSQEQPVSIGDLTIQAFRTLHDAIEPYGYTVIHEGKQIAIVTDTGIFSEEMLYNVMHADLLVLEANHDTEILRRGPYPEHLKQRILSEHGHLSNRQAAEALCRIASMNKKKRVVLLAHLSNENNNPTIAEQTVCARLADDGWFTGRDLFLGVLQRDVASPVYSL